MRFDAVLIRESLISTFISFFFFGIEPYFVTFQNADIHIDWGLVILKILRAGRLWGGLTPGG